MQIPGWQVKLDPARIPWRATQHAGVFWLPLHAAEPPALAATPEKSAHAPTSARPGRARDAVVLIRMDPGCGYPAHRHLDVEDVLVLAGGYADDRGEYSAGTYTRYEAGSVHAPVALGDPARATDETNPACILFAVARGGVENLSGP